MNRQGGDHHRRRQDETGTREDDHSQHRSGQKQVATLVIRMFDAPKQEDQQQWAKEKVQVLAQQLEREMSEHVDVHQRRERQQEGETADGGQPLSNHQIHQRDRQPEHETLHQVDIGRIHTRNRKDQRDEVDIEESVRQTGIAGRQRRHRQPVPDNAQRKLLVRVPVVWCAGRKVHIVQKRVRPQRADRKKCERQTRGNCRGGRLQPARSHGFGHTRLVALTIRFHPSLRSLDARVQRNAVGNSSGSSWRCRTSTCSKSLNRSAARRFV